MSDFAERHALILFACASGILTLIAGGIIVALIN